MHRARNPVRPSHARRGRCVKRKLRSPRSSKNTPSLYESWNSPPNESLDSNNTTNEERTTCHNMSSDVYHYANSGEIVIVSHLPANLRQPVTPHLAPGRIDPRTSLQRSARHATNEVVRFARGNRLGAFVTFTYDLKHRSPSPAIATRHPERFRQRLYRELGRVPYLLVAEKGEFGGLHWHGLLLGTVSESLANQCWPYGEIDYQRLDDIDQVTVKAGYMAKSFASRDRVFRQRYRRSNGFRQIPAIYRNVEHDVVNQIIDQHALDPDRLDRWGPGRYRQERILYLPRGYQLHDEEARFHFGRLAAA